jgi:hypothetical protein
MTNKTLFSLVSAGVVLLVAGFFYLDTDSVPRVESATEATAAVGMDETVPDASAEPNTAPAETYSLEDKVPVPASPEDPSAKHVTAAAERRLPYPLILQEFDYEAAGLSEIQIQEITSLREEFVREVGGPEQKPDDPSYAERWRKLQPQYDEKLRARFGSGFAEALARLAVQVEYDATQPQ